MVSELAVSTRYSDPTTAQFLSRDPAVARTLTPYGYVSDNPLNNEDPTGLMQSDCDVPWSTDNPICFPADAAKAAGTAIAAGAAAGAAIYAAAAALWSGLTSVSPSTPSAAEPTWEFVHPSPPSPNSNTTVDPTLGMGGMACNWLFARQQPETPEEEAAAHDLADQGEAILGRGHNPANVDAWRVWWGTLSRQDKAFYDWAGGPRPARQ